MRARAAVAPRPFGLSCWGRRLAAVRKGWYPPMGAKMAPGTGRETTIRMSRKTSGAILCPSCRRITNANADVCLFCGRRRPGMWGLAPGLHHLLGSLDVAKAVTVICVALYVASLVIDPAAAFRPRGPFELLAPSGKALDQLGMTGALAWEAGRWWTL